MPSTVTAWFTAAMLMLFCGALCAQSLPNERLDVSKVRKIGDAVKVVEQLSGFRLAYQSDLLSLEQSLQWAETELPLRTVLDRIAAAAGLEYRVNRQQIIFLKPLSGNTNGKPGNTTLYSLNGFVSDADTGEKLIGATVFDLETQSGTITNEYGFFALRLPMGTVKLRMSYLGYNAHETILDLQSDTRLDVPLKPNQLTLGEVVVTASEQLENQNSGSTLSPDLAAIRKMPALAGEVDILRSLQLLPGISTGSEGSSGLFVRGGSPDQNLIIADGVPLYNVSHLFGFLSVFNADAIHHIDVVKGGFPARYGGRLSSVLDISLKEGNMKKWQGSATAGMVASKFSVEGPIAPEKASLFISGRRSFVEPFLRPITRRQKQEAGAKDGFTTYNFYDLNAKVNWRITDKDRIFISYYQGKDYYEDQTERENSFGGVSTTSLKAAKIDWGNRIASLRWNHLFSPQLFSNVSLFFSRYNFETTQEDSLRILSSGKPNSSRSSLGQKSLVRDWGLKIDMNYFPTHRHNVRFGAQAIRHLFQQEFDSFIRTISDTRLSENLGNFSEPNPNWEGFLYVEDEINRGGRIGINIGLHASFFAVKGAQYTSIQPRVSLRWKTGNHSAIKIGFARMTQFLHLLSNSGVGLPTDLWIGATQDIQPQQAWQLGLSYVRSFNPNWEFTGETYFKRMNGLIDYKEGSSFFFNTSRVADNVAVGAGVAYGLEVMLAKRNGRTNGWVAYTLSRSFRQFDELNRGQRFPFTYDRPHDFSIVVNHNLAKRWRFSATWVYGSGRAVTIPVSSFTENTTLTLPNTPNVDLLTDYSERNAYRLKPYHRLDIGLSHEKTLRWGKQNIQISLYNAYNRLNTFYLGLERNIAADGSSRFSDNALFPIIPSISYGITF